MQLAWRDRVWGRPHRRAQPNAVRAAHEGDDAPECNPSATLRGKSFSNVIDRNSNGKAQIEPKPVATEEAPRKNGAPPLQSLCITLYPTAPIPNETSSASQRTR